MKYQYTSISGQGVIRLLTLLPGSLADTLRGELTLCDVKDKPKYEAVSYVWGDPAHRDEILIDGKSLGLTRSLGLALRRFRRNQESRQLWADQISINQNDVPERNSQVKLMNDIYRNATHILSWLGEDVDKDAKSAFDLIRMLSTQTSYCYLADDFAKAQNALLETSSYETWVPLHNFFELPWFKRVWIGQEIGTDAPATLYWGHESVDWQMLGRLCFTLERHFHLFRTRFDISPHMCRYLYRRFVYNKNKSRSNFMFELHRGRPRVATDPRDYVFALLGHFSAKSGQEQIPLVEVDYSLGIGDISHRVAYRTLELLEDLTVLNVVQYNDVDKDDYLQRLSWVPRWGQKIPATHVLGYPGSIFHAANSSVPKVSLNEAKDVLSIAGAVIDVVESTSETFGHKTQFHSDNTHLFISRLWVQQCGLSELTLANKYLNHKSTLLAFLQTLSAGCLLTAVAERWYSKPGVERVDMNDRCLADGAAWITERGLGNIKIDPEVLQAGNGGSSSKWQRCAASSTANRKFVRTNKGYFALCSSIVEAGDIICIFLGGKTPYCIRPREESFLFLGECYVHGLMHGEAMTMLEEGIITQQTFRLF